MDGLEPVSIGDVDILFVTDFLVLIFGTGIAQW